MKALILKDDNGENYDMYEEWISNVFLVPDDFDYNKDGIDFYNKTVKESKYASQLKFRKDGSISNKSMNKAGKLYLEYLKEKFKEIKFIE